MVIRAAYLDPPSTDVVQALRALLPSNVKLVEIYGTTEIGNDVYDLLIAGYPNRTHIAAPTLRVLIVPYSGLPLETRALLLERPDVSVHRLRYNGAATAEMAIALLLAAGKNLLVADRQLREHRWATGIPLRTFEGATALVLGYGDVGKRVATLCSSLRMRVLVSRRNVCGADFEQSREGHEIHGPESLLKLLPQADAILICLPLTPDTDGLIGEDALQLMRPTAVLVNIGRAQIVREAALYRALERRALFAAALDVWYSEPRRRTLSTSTAPSRFPFNALDNVIMSPHRSFRTLESERYRIDALSMAVGAAAAGLPIPHRIDVQAGY